MSPEALARLRKDLADQVAPSRDDLRALLDAYDTKDRDHLNALLALETLRAAHAEALDALHRLRDVMRGRTYGLPLNEATTRVDHIAAAVLAKAGRR